MKTALEHRFAKPADLDLLAKWNRQLIRDEGSTNPMNIAQLKARLRSWLKTGEYQAVLFHQGQKMLAYAVYKEDAEELYLRQLFVRRDCRGRGIGHAAMAILIHTIWPRKRLTVSVLFTNPRAFKFYRSVGYQDHCLKFEILPGAG